MKTLLMRGDILSGLVGAEDVGIYCTGARGVSTVTPDIQESDSAIGHFVCCLARVLQRLCTYVGTLTMTLSKALLNSTDQS